MKKMFAFVALSVFATLHSASATSTYLQVVECNSARIEPDNMLNVVVSQYVGPTTIGRPETNASMNLTITASTIAGPRVVGEYNGVRRKPVAPGIMGAPAEFIGKNVRLTIFVDGAPVDGHEQARLVAKLDDGTRLNEDLLCNFVR